MNISLVLGPGRDIYMPSYELALLKGILKREGHDVFIYDFNNAFYRLNREYEDKSDNTICFGLDNSFLPNLFIKNRQFVNECVDKILNTNSEVIGFTNYANNIL